MSAAAATSSGLGPQERPVVQEPALSAEDRARAKGARTRLEALERLAGARGVQQLERPLPVPAADLVAAPEHAGLQLDVRAGLSGTAQSDVSRCPRWRRCDLEHVEVDVENCSELMDPGDRLRSEMDDRRLF